MVRKARGSDRPTRPNARVAPLTRHGTGRGFAEMLQLVALASASWAPSCPPVSTFGNKLNLTAFTEHTWHIQEQQLTGYRARNKAP